VNGPGGAAIAGEVQRSSGCESGVVTPPGAFSVSSVDHAGTATGPTGPEVALSPVAATAPRHHTDPGGRARARSNSSAASAVSTNGAASSESRAMRRRKATGAANGGVVATVQLNRGVTVVTGPASGASGVTPRGKTTLAVASGRPAPRIESGADQWLA
jgi:hypothetical protein